MVNKKLVFIEGLFKWLYKGLKDTLTQLYYTFRLHFFRMIRKEGSEYRIKNVNYSIDSCFYVIRGAEKNGYLHLGLGNIEHLILMNIIYAVQKGWVPIIDMKNYRSIYQEENEFSRTNIWEKYFEQPCDYSLDDVSKAKTVVYSDMTGSLTKAQEMKCRNKRGFVAEAQKKYIREKKEVLSASEDEWRKISKASKSIVGVVCRGTDIIGLGWKTYPAPASVLQSIYDMNIDKTYQYIFLATEDENVLHMFLHAFRDQLIYAEQQRYVPQAGKYLCDYTSTRENDKYWRGFEYLKVANMLANCDSITGMAGAPMSMALRRNPDLRIL